MISKLMKFVIAVSVLSLFVYFVLAENNMTQQGPHDVTAPMAPSPAAG